MPPKTSSRPGSTHSQSSRKSETAVPIRLQVSPTTSDFSGEEDNSSARQYTPPTTGGDEAETTAGDQSDMSAQRYSVTETSLGAHNVTDASAQHYSAGETTGEDPSEVSANDYSQDLTGNVTGASAVLHDYSQPSVLASNTASVNPRTRSPLGNPSLTRSIGASLQSRGGAAHRTNSIRRSTLSEAPTPAQPAPLMSKEEILNCNISNYDSLSYINGVPQQLAILRELQNKAYNRNLLNERERKTFSDILTKLNYNKSEDATESRTFYQLLHYEPPVANQEHHSPKKIYTIRLLEEIALWFFRPRDFSKNYAEIYYLKNIFLPAIERRVKELLSSTYYLHMHKEISNLAITWILVHKILVHPNNRKIATAHDTQETELQLELDFDLIKNDLLFSQLLNTEKSPVSLSELLKGIERAAQYIAENKGTLLTPHRNDPSFNSCFAYFFRDLREWIMNAAAEGRLNSMRDIDRLWADRRSPFSWINPSESSGIQFPNAHLAELPLKKILATQVMQTLPVSAHAENIKLNPYHFYFLPITQLLMLPILLGLSYLKIIGTFATGNSISSDMDTVKSNYHSYDSIETIELVKWLLIASAIYFLEGLTILHCLISAAAQLPIFPRSNESPKPAENIKGDLEIERADRVTEAKIHFLCAVAVAVKYLPSLVVGLSVYIFAEITGNFGLTEVNHTIPANATMSNATHVFVSAVNDAVETNISYFAAAGAALFTAAVVKCFNGGKTAINYDPVIDRSEPAPLAEIRTADNNERTPLLSRAGSVQ
jgi:hypothetical protein